MLCTAETDTLRTEPTRQAEISYAVFCLKKKKKKKKKNKNKNNMDKTDFIRRIELKSPRNDNTNRPEQHHKSANADKVNTKNNNKIKNTTNQPNTQTRQK